MPIGLGEVDLERAPMGRSRGLGHDLGCGIECGNRLFNVVGSFTVDPIHVHVAEPEIDPRPIRSPLRSRVFERLRIGDQRPLQSGRSPGSVDAPVLVAELTPHLTEQIIARGLPERPRIGGNRKRQRLLDFLSAQFGRGGACLPRRDDGKRERIESCVSFGCDLAEPKDPTETTRASPKQINRRNDMPTPSPNFKSRTLCAEDDG